MKNKIDMKRLRRLAGTDFKDVKDVGLFQGLARFLKQLFKDTTNEHNDDSSLPIPTMEHDGWIDNVLVGIDNEIRNMLMSLNINFPQLTKECRVFLQRIDKMSDIQKEKCVTELLYERLLNYIEFTDSSWYNYSYVRKLSEKEYNDVLNVLELIDELRKTVPITDCIVLRRIKDAEDFLVRNKYPRIFVCKNCSKAPCQLSVNCLNKISESKIDFCPINKEPKWRFTL